MYPYPYANNPIPIPNFSPTNNNLPEIQYVVSPESADNYNLPPNKTVVLFNQNSDEFYIVQTDASGSRVRNDFTFKPKAKAKPSEYVTKDEFEAFKNRCEEILTNNNRAPKKDSQRVTEVDK